MPIHVYRCDDCGTKFERLLKMSAPDPEVCPNCGKRHTVRRLMSAPAFRLAGSGWYETDFKSSREEKHNLAGDGDKPHGTPEKAAEAPKSTGIESPKPAAAAAGSKG